MFIKEMNIYDYLSSFRLVFAIYCLSRHVFLRLMTALYLVPTPYCQYLWRLIITNKYCLMHVGAIVVLPIQTIVSEPG